jgi:hypothetical protein
MGWYVLMAVALVLVQQRLSGSSFLAQLPH